MCACQPDVTHTLRIHHDPVPGTDGEPGVPCSGAQDRAGTCDHSPWHRKGRVNLHRYARRAYLWNCGKCGQRMVALYRGNRLHLDAVETDAGDWVSWLQQATRRESLAMALRNLGSPVLGLFRLVFLVLAALATCTVRFPRRVLGSGLVLLVLCGLGFLAADLGLRAWARTLPAGNPLLAVPEVEQEALERSAREIAGYHVGDFIRTGQRVHDVAWKLLVAAAPECAGSEPSTGLSLSRENYYPNNGPYTEALGSNVTTIGFVPAGSPAADAGLRRGDVLLSAGGRSLPAGETGKSSLVRTQETIRQAAAEAARVGTPLMLGLRRGQELLEASVPTVTACPQKISFNFMSLLNAATDQASMIVVFRGLIGPDTSDADIALAVGHEIGHMVVAKTDGEAPAWVDTAAAIVRLVRGDLPAGMAGRPSRSSQEIESACDAVGVRLATRAGFDVSDATAFMSRLAGADLSGMDEGGTHPGSAHRLFVIRRVLENLHQAQRGVP